MRKLNLEVLRNRHGDQRVVRKFAWLPTRMSEGSPADPELKVLGWVWWELYEQYEVWYDRYFNQRYEWRVVSRLPVGFLAVMRDMHIGSSAAKSEAKENPAAPKRDGA